MNFQEKFRRTPKFVVWLITTAIGGALGYLASIPLVPRVFFFSSNLYERVLWRVFGDWDVVIGMALSFAAVPIMMMLVVTCVLPLHHAPRRIEIALAAFIPSMWPAWFTATEVPRSLWREALVAWGVYLALVAGTWLLCGWLARSGHIAKLPDSQHANAMEVGR